MFLSLLYNLFSKFVLVVLLFMDAWHVTITLYFFFFLQQSNLNYVDPQIANLLFEAGQSSTNICYNI